MYVSIDDSHIVSQRLVSYHNAFTVRKYTSLCGFSHSCSLVSTQFPDLWVCCTSFYQDTPQIMLWHNRVTSFLRHWWTSFVLPITKLCQFLPNTDVLVDCQVRGIVPLLWYKPTHLSSCSWFWEKLVLFFNFFKFYFLKVVSLNSEIFFSWGCVMHYNITTLFLMQQAAILGKITEVFTVL